MRILKALSLTFALGVLALAMLGAGGNKSNVMPATKSGRMSGERIAAEPVDASTPLDAGKKKAAYFYGTKSGPMPLVEEAAPQQAPAQTK